MPVWHKCPNMPTLPSEDTMDPKESEFAEQQRKLQELTGGHSKPYAVVRVNEAIHTLRAFLLLENAENRRDLMDILLKHFCRHCLAYIGEEKCYCTREE